MFIISIFVTYFNANIGIVVEIGDVAEAAVEAEAVVHDTALVPEIMAAVVGETIQEQIYENRSGI